MNQTLVAHASACRGELQLAENRGQLQLAENWGEFPRANSTVGLSPPLHAKACATMKLE